MTRRLKARSSHESASEHRLGVGRVGGAAAVRHGWVRRSPTAAHAVARGCARPEPLPLAPGKDALRAHGSPQGSARPGRAGWCSRRSSRRPLGVPKLSRAACAVLRSLSRAGGCDAGLFRLPRLLTRWPRVRSAAPGSGYDRISRTARITRSTSVSVNLGAKGSETVRSPMAYALGNCSARKPQRSR